MGTLTEDEKQELVSEITERILVRMPEVIGNLIREHAASLKVNKLYQERHPEFKPHLDLVRAVVEDIEARNPDMSYEGILEKAVEPIREKIRLKKQAVEQVTNGGTSPHGLI